MIIESQEGSLKGRDGNHRRQRWNRNETNPLLKKVANFLKNLLTFYKINDTIVNVKNNKYF
jgi:hypothetical protein